MKQKVILWTVVGLLVVAVGGLAYEANAVAKGRRDRESVRAELATVTADLAAESEKATELEDNLAETERQLSMARGKVERIRDSRDTFKAKTRQLERRLAESEERAEALSGLSAEAIALVEAKAACLDVVLDAYNQFVFYEDIGIALERALDSQACARAGIF